MPVCYMMIGVPGSGKSTLVSGLLRENPALEVVSMDKYIDEYALKKNKTYEEVYREYCEQAEKKMKLDLVDFIKNKKDFIWDQTNVIKGSRGKKIRRLLSEKFEVVAYFFDIPFEVVEKRIVQRFNEGGKKISHALLKKFMDELERPSLEEGFSKMFVIDELGVVKVFDNKDEAAKIKLP